MRISRLSGPPGALIRKVGRAGLLRIVTVIAVSVLWHFGGALDARAAGPPLRVLAFGDSLTAGYGLDDIAMAFPAQLERALRAKGHEVTVIQSGVSGETTTGGLTRIDWALGEKPDAVIVALGGNDGLRAIDPVLTEKNMRGIAERIARDRIPVLIAGMLAPPNLGRDYGEQFKAAFERVAKEAGAVFYPFFLDGVAGDPTLNQADRIHPTEKGVAVMVERIMPSVEELLSRARAARS
jgi:acyl-CoA thioesterase-1